MVRSLALKARARAGGGRRALGRRNGLNEEVDKLERMEMDLQDTANKIMLEVDKIEDIKGKGTGTKHEFAWIKGKLTILTMQDFVGAAFGAVFFVVTQEVWELSAKLGSFNAILLVLVGLVTCFLLVYLSRRRKMLSTQIYHTTILRGIEIYLISLFTAFLFITIFGTATELSLIIKQMIVVAFPAAISAATADLLFF